MNTNTIEKEAIRQIKIIKVVGDKSIVYEDDVAIEEPLEIRISYGPSTFRTTKNLSVTMRTPGNDAELALGFLFTEGIITDWGQIKTVGHVRSVCERNQENIVNVELSEDFVPQLMKTDRNFYTTSSCGVCGKGSIESIRTVSPFHKIENSINTIALDTLYLLSEKLKFLQYNFSATGGIHASGLFDLEGNLIALREDVGRHNALDKLIGYALSIGKLPLTEHILVLSGRASFELVQKAAMAGITVVAAIGAPSSLAVDLAKEFDITLLGFLRSNRFNIYHQGKNFNIKSL